MESERTTWLCRSDRSCLTNLLETLEKWTEYLDAGYGLDVVYLDYRKAFDTVPHRRLLISRYQWQSLALDKSFSVRQRNESNG